MARPKKSEEPGTQLEIPEKVYAPRLGSVKVPMVTEGKLEWVDVPASRFDKAAQDALFNHWDELKRLNPSFNIEAKIAKLLIEVE